MSLAPIALLATIRLNLLRRPLLHASTVEDCLDISPFQLLALIESGALPWAWNLAAGRSRKEIRVLAHSVVERAIGTAGNIGATRNLKLPEVIGLILPKLRPSLKGTELQRLFHIGPDLVRYLSEAKVLSLIPENRPAKGINSSPRFTRVSVVKLLETRRLN